MNVLKRALLITLFLLAGRSTPASSSPAPTDPPAPRRVLVISSDGLRPDAIQQVETPNVDALIERGAVSWTARTVLPSVTLPAHASMLSGQAVAQHGLYWDRFIGRSLYLQGTSLHQLAREDGLRSVLVIASIKLLHLVAPGTFDQLIFQRGLDSSVALRAAEAAAEGFDFTFVHLPANDVIGHRRGWMSPAYLQNVEDTDLALGILVSALDQEGLLDETVILFTADHGGHDHDHFEGTPEDTTIPWIIAGPGVRAGITLQGPVSVMDTAPTAATLLGLPVPGEWRGKVVREALENPPEDDFTAGTWSLGTPQPTPTSEMPAALLDDLIYVAGGFGDVTGFHAYDPRTDSWTALAPLPEGRHHGTLVGYRRRLYYFGGAAPGGFVALTDAWRYSPASDRWTAIASLPEPRLGGAAVALGDRIYFVGGQGGGLDLLAYDPATDEWQRLAPLSTLRDHLAAVALDGALYALGGRNVQQGELSSVEIYDPATDRWSEGVPMRSPRSGAGATTFRGQIVAAGGELIYTRRITIDTVEFFNPEAAAWSFGPDMPVGVHGMPLVAFGDRLYVIGGSERAGGIENAGRVMVYAPDLQPRPLLVHNHRHLPVGEHGKLECPTNPLDVDLVGGEGQHWSSESEH